MLRPAGRVARDGWHGRMSGRLPYGVLLGIAVVLVVAAGVAVGYVLGGGGSGGSGGVVEAVADDLAGRADGMLTAGEARCTAEALADGWGRPRLEELGGGSDEGLRIDELTDDEGRTFARVSYDCLDDRNVTRHLEEMWIPLQVTTPEERTCFAEGFVDEVGPQRARDVLVEIFVDSMTDLHDHLEEPERDLVDAIEARCYGPGGGT